MKHESICARKYLRAAIHHREYKIFVADLYRMIKVRRVPTPRLPRGDWEQSVSTDVNDNSLDLSSKPSSIEI